MSIASKAQTNCRHFSGYKPCGKSQFCDANCSSLAETAGTILFIHLGALGAVVRSTALIKALKRKHPNHKLIWLTDSPADKILHGHPEIDAVYATGVDSQTILSNYFFSSIYVVDKSLKATGLAEQLKSEKRFGFKADPHTGAILPATESAEELWSLGLSDHQKFFVNRKSEIQLVHEALELGTYVTDDYALPLSTIEEKVAQSRRLAWAMDPLQPIIGLNTGCSDVIPYKKWTVDFHRKVIFALQNIGYSNIVLLGGPEDEERNQQIAAGLPVIVSDCKSGLRDGLTSVAACDIVISGDSLGMHMAISQSKQVIAWFGPTCAHEIEFYGRGEVLLSKANCSPCWMRSCNKALMCYDQVPISDVIAAVKRSEEKWRNQYLSSKLLFSETSSFL